MRRETHVSIAHASQIIVITKHIFWRRFSILQEPMSVWKKHSINMTIWVYTKWHSSANWTSNQFCFDFPQYFDCKHTLSPHWHAFKPITRARLPCLSQFLFAYNDGAISFYIFYCSTNAKGRKQNISYIKSNVCNFQLLSLYFCCFAAERSGGIHYILFSMRSHTQIWRNLRVCRFIRGCRCFLLKCFARSCRRISLSYMLCIFSMKIWMCTCARAAIIHFAVFCHTSHSFSSVYICVCGAFLLCADTRYVWGYINWPQLLIHIYINSLPPLCVKMNLAWKMQKPVPLMLSRRGRC